MPTLSDHEKLAGAAYGPDLSNPPAGYSIVAASPLDEHGLQAVAYQNVEDKGSQSPGNSR